MSARSLLYVPGDRPDRFEKAMASGADAVILDLEDAVAHPNKQQARDHIAAYLKDRAPGSPTVWVRVNGGDLLHEDIRGLPLDNLDGLYLPKASAEQVALVAAITDTPVTALIESARGVLDAEQIAASPTVVRLAIGEADLGSELGVTDTGAFAPMRAQVVLASAAAGIDAPVGPVSTDFRDLDALRASTEALLARGFGGRAAIHPAQVAAINEVFTPTAEQVARARRLLEIFERAGGGVCVDDEGRMVDEAVVRASKELLERARPGRL